MQSSTGYPSALKMMEMLQSDWKITHCEGAPELLKNVIRVMEYPEGGMLRVFFHTLNERSIKMAWIKKGTPMAI